MITAVFTTLVLAGLLAGCGANVDDPSEEASGTYIIDEVTPVSIEVNVADGDVAPKGDRIEVPLGMPIQFTINSDAPGTLHVHSSPEQEVPYAVGETVKTIIINTPGVVQVEAHDPSQTVVQLQVQ
jgi:hypothetical protein